MQRLFANQWFSPSFIQSIGWTLLHSLWQGVIAAVVALIILSLTKKSSPVFRYNLLLVVFMLFIAVVGSTFSLQYSLVQKENLSAFQETATLKNASISAANAPLTIVEKTKDYLAAFKQRFQNNANLIVGIWFLIFCAQALRLTTSLGYIYRIRRYKTFLPSPAWMKRCTELKDGLGIQKPVSLLESALVKVPVVIGFFKPLILLPVGLLANLPYNQVESILLHELAHIKRRDYLVNLLQTLVEAIFFFNPAILWISSLIKDEREACCDDIAVRNLGSKSHYIQALVSFQEFAMKPGYAMAFPGQNNSLLQRVKRIIHKENKKLSSMEKTIMFCGIVLITAAFVLSTKESKAQKEVSASISKTLPNKRDTVPETKLQNGATTPHEKKRTSTRVTTDDNGREKVMRLESNNGSGRELKGKLKDNKLVELFVNGKKIQESELSDYDREVKSIIDEQQQQAALAVQKASVAHQTLSEKVSQLNSQQQKLAEASQADEKRERQSPSNQHVKSGEAQIMYKNSDEDDSHQQVEKILNFLKAANVIEGKEGTTFKLTSSELLVNGVKQSSQLHKELSQKYIYRPGDFYTFSSAGGTTDITVHRED